METGLVTDETEGGIQYFKGYLAEDCSYSVVFLKKEDNIPYHKHSKTKTVMIKLDGDGELLINGKNKKMDRLVYIPPGAPHTVRTKNKLIFLCIENPPDDDDFIEVKER